LGIVFGVALHEIAVGLLIGAVLGVVPGMVWAAKAKRQPPGD
jgi:Mg/Co/Ni transporter MgtE